MLTLDRSQDAKLKERDLARCLRVRVRPNGPVVDLPLGKTTVGSSPRCNVRIQQPGVQPLHCLIVNDAGSLTVRRWSGDTLLNGQRLEEAPLEPGDRLQVGAIELEIEGAETAPAFKPLPAARVDAFAAPAAFSPPTTIVAATPIAFEYPAPASLPVPASLGAPVTPVAAAVPAVDLNQIRTGRDAARQRSRKILAALRHKRDSERGTQSRVVELERQLDEATAERIGFAGQLQEATSALAAARQLAEDHRAAAANNMNFAAENETLSREIHTLIQRVDQLSAENTAAFAAQRQLSDAHTALTAESKRLTDENGNLRTELDAHVSRCAELTNERDSLRSEFDSLRSQFEVQSERAAVLADDAQRLGSELHQSTSHSNELAEQLNVACQERNEARSLHNELQSRFDEASNRLDSVCCERDELRGQRDALQADAAALRDRESAASDSSARLEAELNDVRSRAVEVARQLSQSQEESRQLASELNASNGEVEETCRQRDALEAEAATLNEQASAAHERIDQLEHELAQQRGHCTELENRLSGVLQERDNRDSQNEQLRSELQELANVRHALADVEASAKRERAELQTQLQIAAEVAEAQTRREAELVADCKRLQKEYDRLPELEQKLHSAISDRENTSSELYRALLQLAEIQDRDKHNQALEAAHTLVTAELERSHQDIAQLQEQIDSLSAERIAADDARHTLDQRSDELVAAQRALSEENAGLTAELSEMRRAISAQTEELRAAQTSFAGENKGMAADLAEARQELEAAHAHREELVSRLEAAQAWRDRCDQTEQKATDLAVAVTRLQDELAARHASESANASLVEDRQQRLGFVEKQLVTAMETIQLLEHELSAADELAGSADHQRDEWREALDEALRQNNDLAKQVEILQSQLVEARSVQAKELKSEPAAGEATGAFNWSSGGTSHSFGETAEQRQAETFAATPENDASGFSWGSVNRDDAMVEESADELAPDSDVSEWKTEATSAGSSELPSWASESLSEDTDATLATEPVASSDPFARLQTPPKTGTQPVSFIERYSHMIESDEPQNEPSAPLFAKPAQREEDNSIKPRTTGVVRSGGASQTQRSDDEESIEDYMAKLLQRVRGESSGGALETAAAPTVEKAQPNMSPAEVSPGPLTAQLAETTNTGASPFKFEPAKRRSSVPAPQTDLEALRALANESARRAISRHSLRKHRRNAVTKVIVSALAGFTSLWLMLNSETWLSGQFMAGCITMLISAYWAGETCRTLLVSFRIAASDDVDPDTDAEIADLSKELRSPLPIDVDSPRPFTPEVATASDEAVAATEGEPELQA